MKKLLTWVVVCALCLGMVSFAQAEGSTLQVACSERNQWIPVMAEKYMEQHPDVKVELIPISSTSGDMYTKMSMMMMSPETSPDVITEDGFMVNSDAAAGYLEKLDDRVANWADWDQFVEAVKAGGYGEDGSVYGIPTSTDVQVLYYSKTLMQKIGKELPWQPKDWAEMLDAARAIKALGEEETYPMFLYLSKVTGEQTSMRTFQTLMSGTGVELYDAKEGKWLVDKKAIGDVLTFLKAAVDEELVTPFSLASNSRVEDILNSDIRMNAHLGFGIDGSWVPGNWRATGNFPWPEAMEEIGVAAVPTQFGQEPGYTTMSGGWTLALCKNGDEKDLGWDFIAFCASKEGLLEDNQLSGDMTPRMDVAADPSYTSMEHSIYDLTTTYLEFTHFRPTYDNYPAVSTLIQEMCESIATGSMNVEQALNQYISEMQRVVGEENVIVR